jgi:murein L,D-transpeptidase YafK
LADDHRNIPWHDRAVVLLIVPLLYAMAGPNAPYPGGPSPVSSTVPDRAEQAAARVRPLLATELTRLGLEWGDPVFLRIFKESAELELWMQPERGQPFTLVRVYRIAAMSGKLGPKTKEGDMQAPEGFYRVTRGSLNPRSSYHLSFNLGYPNAYDRALGRTGDFLMVHGKAASVGCYAMTDDSIEQIYSLVSAALDRGQTSTPVHCFPFRMTDERMAMAAGGPSSGFWTELHAGYLRFESSRLPPVIEVREKRYVLAD